MNQENRRCNKCGVTKSLNKDNFYLNKKANLFNYHCIKCTKDKYVKVSDLTEEELQKRRLKDNKKYKKKKEFAESNGIKLITKKKETAILNSYKTNDKNKNREFNLTFEFVQNSLKEPCSYCGFPSTGLDRIDNNKGHLIENCIPCCAECNVARMDNFTVSEMKLIGQAIKIVKLNRILNNKI